MAFVAGVARSTPSLALALFFALQGLVLVFDVPIGLSQHLRSLIFEMPPLDIVADWAILAIITTLSNALLACVLALLCVCLDRAGALSVSRSENAIVLTGLFLFVASAVYSVFVVSLPGSRLIVFGVSSITLVSVVVGLMATFAAHRFDTAGSARERLVIAGKAFTLLALATAPFAIVSGVGIAGYPHAKPTEPVATNAPAGSPNIVFVISDTLRASALSIYGGDTANSPQIARLAQSGAVVDGMTATANYTVPTTATMFSGVEPFRHRVTGLYSYFADGSSVSKQEMLPALLHAAGYTTAAVVGNSNGRPMRLRIQEQFDDLYIPPPHCSIGSYIPFQFTNTDIASTTELFRVLSYGQRVFSLIICPTQRAPDPPTSVTYGQALSWLDGSRDSRRPFLLWVHTVPPHAPYLPPSPYLRSIDKSSDFTTPSQFFDVNIHFYRVNAGQLPAKDVQTLSHRYLENVRYADAEFGKFFEALKARNLLHNTIIVYTADHGETFRRWLTHDGPFLDDDLVKVPFIVWGPSIKSGHHATMRVSQVDIAPTLLALAGIGQPKQMRGRSLVPLLQGQHMPERPVFAEQVASNPRSGLLTRGSFAVVLHDWKYVQYLDRTPHEELFHLAVDPHETKNVASVHPEHTARLRSVLEEHFKGAKRPLSTGIVPVRTVLTTPTDGISQ